MAKIESVIIVGLGALGSVYATKLIGKKDVDLRILIDLERKNRYEDNGIIFNGKRYDFNYLLPGTKCFIADLVIIATKSNDIAYALECLKKFVGRNTAIISLLNGITSEGLIRGYYSYAYVPYAFFSGHNSTRTNSAIIHDGVGTVYLGEAYNPVQTEKLSRITEFFDDNEIEYAVPEDMLYELWQQFIINVGYDQSSVILNADYAIFQKNKNVSDFADKLMLEAVNIAKASSIKNADHMIESAHFIRDHMPPTAKSSMYMDFETKRPMEIGLLGGQISRLGKELGIPTPCNDLIIHILQIRDEINRDVLSS